MDVDSRNGKVKTEIKIRIRIRFIGGIARLKRVDHSLHHWIGRFKK
jgi:hypothetical protein